MRIHVLPDSRTTDRNLVLEKFKPIVAAIATKKQTRMLDAMSDKPVLGLDPHMPMCVARPAAPISDEVINKQSNQLGHDLGIVASDDKQMVHLTGDKLWRHAKRTC